MIEKASDNEIQACNYPAVSVCIPTWNRSSLLKFAIESVLLQTFIDFELLILDNASTDETEHVVRGFHDPRIKYLKQDQHVGIAENWERCLKNAKGSYIVFLPDDDVMEKDNIDEKVAFFARFPQVGLVHSRYHAIDQVGCLVQANIAKCELFDQHEDLVFPSDKALEQLIECNAVHESTTMFRRSCCDVVGGFRTELNFAMDWEFWMRVATKYDIGFLAKPLIKWRLHSQSNTSKNLFKDGKPTINRLTDRLLALRMIDVHASSLGRSVRSRIGKQLGRIIYVTGSEVLEGATAPREVRHQILKMCWFYPRLWTDHRVLRVLAKTCFSNRMLNRLRGMRGQVAVKEKV